MNFGGFCAIFLNFPGIEWIWGDSMIFLEFQEFGANSWVFGEIPDFFGYLMDFLVIQRILPEISWFSLNFTDFIWNFRNFGNFTIFFNFLFFTEWNFGNLLNFTNLIRFSGVSWIFWNLTNWGGNWMNFGGNSWTLKNTKFLENLMTFWKFKEIFGKFKWKRKFKLFWGHLMNFFNVKTLGGI